MLIVRAYVNERMIDQVHIQNVGESAIEGIYEYKIRYPYGYGKMSFYHKREEGWKELASMVLKAISREELFKQLKEDYDRSVEENP